MLLLLLSHAAAVLLCAASGAARAVHDALSHSPGCLTRYGAWWDNATSWKLKYKNADPTAGPAFPGATTVLVFITDAWHFFNFLAWGFADAAFLLAGWPSLHWWAVAAVLARRAVFEPLYSHLRAQ